MISFITVIHYICCVSIVGLVLIQSGKGAEISASFAGSSQTVFGSSGSANFFQKATGIFAGVFFLTSLSLTLLGGRVHRSIFEGQSRPTTSIPVPAVPAVPANPADAKAGATAPEQKQVPVPAN